MLALVPLSKLLGNSKKFVSLALGGGALMRRILATRGKHLFNFLVVGLVVGTSSCARQHETLIFNDPGLPAQIHTALDLEINKTIESLTTEPSTPAPQTSAPRQRGFGDTQQIADDFIENTNIMLQCGRTPRNCPIDKITAPDTGYRVYMNEKIKMRIESNLATRPGAGKYKIRIDSIEKIGTTTALVHTCLFDSLVVFDSGQSNTIRDDIIFDDDIVSTHTTWTLYLDEGRWKWAGSTPHDATSWKDICGFDS